MPEPRYPKVGDWAEHRQRELDPRQVTRVEPFVFDPTPRYPDGTGVWIMLLDNPAGPFPADQYDFTAPTTQEGQSA